MAETDRHRTAADLDRLVYVAIAEARRTTPRPTCWPASPDTSSSGSPTCRPAVLTPRDRRAAGADRRAPAGPGDRSGAEQLVADEPAADPGRAGADHAAVRDGGPRLHPGVLPQPPRRGPAAAPGGPAGPAVRPVRPGRALPAGDLAAPVRPGQGAARRRRGHRRRPDRRSRSACRPTQHAVAMLDAVPLEPLRQFVLDRSSATAGSSSPAGPGRLAGQRWAPR